MRVLDLDMDYFMKTVANNIDESETSRLPDEEYGEYVWSETEVRNFLEINLGLSKNRRIRGRIVAGHNESLFYWKELIESHRLTVPFEVVHVDSHADMGLGYVSWRHIWGNLLEYPVDERPFHSMYYDLSGNARHEGIGDYLLFAVAYRWISRLTYCGNPSSKPNDYHWFMLKDFKEEYIWEDPVHNTIQLLYNPNSSVPKFSDSEILKREFIQDSKKEPEVPFTIIPTIEDVNFDGAFDFAILAQSPNYTPPCADFIMDIFRDYINEE